MSEDTTPAAEDVATEPGTDIITAIKARSGVGYRQGAEAENRRLTAIDTIARGLSQSVPDIALDIEALAEHARGDVSITPERFNKLALDIITGTPAPISSEAPVADQRMAPSPGMNHRPLVQAGSTNIEKAMRGMELAILEGVGSESVTAEQMEGNTYRGWSLLDYCRECLELGGTNVRGMNSEQIARAAIAQGQRAIDPGTANYATANFPAVTENVITKRVHDGYNAAPVTWDQWCSTFEVPDFKQFTVPRLSQISNLPIVAENALYTDLTRVDEKESATLVKHGGLMSLTWEALTNDDRRMFDRTAASMGEAAARTVDTNAYGVLTASPGAGPVQGPTMGDGNQLFDGPNHGNVGVAALDLNAWVAARTAMARQTDDNNLALGIVARYLIVPEELRDTADNLAGSEYLPWVESSPGAQRVNTIRSTFTVVATIRLTDATDWYVAGAAGGTVEIAFLRGNRMPALFREEGWSTDAMHWKVRHPHIAYPVDWRALYASIVAGG